MNHRHVLAAVAVALSTGVVSIGTSGLALGTMMVTTCGQSVSGDAMLAGDLDCSAGPDPALDLANGTRLALAGFTLTGNMTGIQCEVGSCKITGPGTIRRSAPLPPNSNTVGVLGLKRAKLDGVIVENWDSGVYVLGPAYVRNSTIQSNYRGILGAPLRATDSSFVGNYYGTWASEGTKDGIHYIFWSSKIVRCTFSGNTIDVAGFKRPTVRNSACTTSDQLTIPLTPWGGGDEWDVCP